MPIRSPGSSRLHCDDYVVIGLSGRALAQAAWRSQLRVHVLDCCSDLDTRACTLSATRIGTLTAGFSDDELLQALAPLRKRPLGIVIGSGFEDRIDLLERLEHHQPVFGNTASVVQAVKDPQIFFSALAALKIPFPEVRSLPVRAPGTWLVKRRGGSGGGHIRLAAPAETSKDDYAQKHLDGIAESLVFMADTKQAWALGFSRGRLAPTATAPFRYGGAETLNPARIADRSNILAAATTIVRKFQLRGLCGLDFLRSEDGSWHILEVNPRPPASFELHDRSGWLFRAHLNACAGRGCFVAPPMEAYQSRGHTVVYARDDVTIARSTWPEWVSDRPMPGDRIAAGQPVCTVHAESRNEALMRTLLSKRAVAVGQGLHLQPGW